MKRNPESRPTLPLGLSVKYRPCGVFWNVFIKSSNALSGHENALFFSLQRHRLSVDSVEYIVNKYASQFIPRKNITPHKLRSTYGTSLYQETGDIYLVADVLGHKDVNATRKHYAAMQEDKD